MLDYYLKKNWIKEFPSTKYVLISTNLFHYYNFQIYKVHVHNLKLIFEVYTNDLIFLATMEWLPSFS